MAKKSRTRRSPGPGPARPRAAGQRAAGQRAAASVGAASSGAASVSTVQPQPEPGQAEAGQAEAGQAEAGQPAGYPGQRFGLPERGPGSVASMPRRVLALLVDWLLSMLIAYWLTHSQFWTILVFAIEVYVLTATTGFTIGKRLTGIRTVRTTGGPVGFGWALVRTAILLTVVPPLLTDRDLRGMHDRASDTIVIRA